MTVGGRIYLKKDNSGLELVKAFAKIPTANIADTRDVLVLCIQELSCFPVRMERYGQELPLLSNLVGEITFLYTQLWIWLEKVM